MRKRAAGAAAAIWGTLALAGASPGRCEDRSFELAVTAAEGADPVTFTVRRGDTVVITLKSAIAAEIHLHGYNLEARLAPGGTASWRFTARATGRYPINVHRPGAAAGHRHAPPIAYLEVRPR